MKRLTFSILKNIKSSKPKSFSEEIDSFFNGIQAVSHEIVKSKNTGVSLFNLTDARNGRKTEDIHNLFGLVLDFDRSESEEYVMSLFVGLKCLIYSSYSYSPNNQSVNLKVIVPFSTRCPTPEWLKRTDAASKKFKNCDPSCLKPTQYQAMPCCSKRGKSHAFIKLQDGELFDWESLEAKQEIERNNKVSNYISSDDNTIDPDTIIRFKKGAIRAGDITGHLREVYCPIHKDKTPSEFIGKNKDGDYFLSCKMCGTFWIKSSRTISHVFKDKTQKIIYPKSWKELVDYHESISAKLTGFSALYGAEGTAKSYMAIVEKQYGIKPILYAKTDPWDYGKINESETIKLIVDQNPEINVEDLSNLLSGFKSDDVVFGSSNIIITTHARLSYLGLRNHYNIVKSLTPAISNGVVIFYDDPVLDDFMTLSTFPDKLLRKEINGQSIRKHIPIKDHRTYYIKPSSLRLGFGFENNTVIVTTTELLIIELIALQRSDIEIYDGLMPLTEKLLGGDVHLISTKLVRAKYDGMLAPIMERIGRHGYEVEYIGNAQGCLINLSNNKGRNNLDEKNTVIEISIPTPDEVMRLFEQFNGEITERNITLALMLDKLHQAVGRNSGYRYKGKSCVVLVDPLYYKDISKYSRYSFESEIVVDKEDVIAFPRKQPEFTSLVGVLSWYLNRHDVYIGDRQKFKYDCIKSLKDLPSVLQVSRRKRITTAIAQLSKDYPRLASKMASITKELISKR